VGLSFKWKVIRKLGTHILLSGLGNIMDLYHSVSESSKGYYWFTNHHQQSLTVAAESFAVWDIVCWWHDCSWWQTEDGLHDKLITWNYCVMDESSWNVVIQYLCIWPWGKADSVHCVMLLRQAMKMATVKIFQWIQTCGHYTTVYLENSC